MAATSSANPHLREVANLAEHTEATISGRVMARRFFGGVLFLDIQDSTGVAQVIVERDHFTGAPAGSSLDTDATLGRNRLEQLEAQLTSPIWCALREWQGSPGKGIPRCWRMKSTWKQNLCTPFQISGRVCRIPKLACATVTLT